MLALKFREHSAGLSSLFFAFATLVIHMCGVSLPVFSIKLATETVFLGSFVRLVLTSTLMRPLRIWTWVFSMAILWRSRRKYVLTTASGAYTRIRLAKIASSFFLLRCAVSLFYSTGIITYVFCNFACPVNILTIITFFPSTSTSLSSIPDCMTSIFFRSTNYAGHCHPIRPWHRCWRGYMQLNHWHLFGDPTIRIE